MAQNPWYTPGGFGGTGNYGADQDWTQTPFTLQYMDPQIPRGVYQDYLSRNGFGGFDRRSLFAQNQYGNTQSGYQAAVRENPTLTYHDYLNQQFGAGNSLNDLWAGLAPEQRGENPSRFVGPTRFIPWG